MSVRGCRGRPEYPSRFADGVPPVRAPDGSSGFLSPSQGVSFHVAKGSVFVSLGVSFRVAKGSVPDFA